jgi:hypothetical protein
MKFRAVVEPPKPMHGLVVPEKIVASLGTEKRPPVIVTINGHQWPTRVAHLRGRYLIGLSNAHRSAAGVEIGDTVTVDITLDTSTREAVIPADLAKALRQNAGTKQVFEKKTVSQQRQCIRVIESAKQEATRARRIAALITELSS